MRTSKQIEVLTLSKCTQGSGGKSAMVSCNPEKSKGGDWVGKYQERLAKYHYMITVRRQENLWRIMHMTKWTARQKKRTAVVFASESVMTS